MTGRLLTARELASRLSVPPRWPLEQARAGTIPHVRLGRYVRFDLADVEAWLEECKSGGRPAAFRTVNPRRT